MRSDALLAFVPIGTNLSLVAGAGIDVQSNVIDLLGGGVGTPVTNIIGNAAQPGSPDAMGVGGMRPELNVTIGAPLAAGTGTPTLNVQLEGAADDGTNNPATWSVLGESGEISVAEGTADTVIARLPWLPPFPENLRPRFLRLNFAIPAGTDFSAGTIASALVTTVRDDWFNRQAARNYTVGPLH